MERLIAIGTLILVLVVIASLLATPTVDYRGIWLHYGDQLIFTTSYQLEDVRFYRGETLCQFEKISSNRWKIEMGETVSNMFKCEARFRNGIVWYTLELDLQKDNVRFVVYGDSRHNRKIHERIFKKIVEFEPDFVVHLGDMVDYGNSSENWQDFFDVVGEYWSKHIVYTVKGNHEFPFRFYNDVLYPPHYFVYRNGMLMIFLDSISSISSGSPQGKFLESLLEKYDDVAEYIMIFMHHPVFTVGPHRKDKIVKELKELVPLLARYRVSVVFGAHDHAFQHFMKDGVNYVVTAGGGAHLYTLRKDIESGAKMLKGLSTHHFLVVDKTSFSLRLALVNKEGKKLYEFSIPSRLKR